MIESYTFGLIVVDGQRYSADLKIIGGQVLPDWWRREGHAVCEEDVADVIAAKPDVFVLGTGAYGIVKVPRAFEMLMESLGIVLIAQPTAQAVETYNELCQTKNVAAGFHLTC